MNTSTSLFQKLYDAFVGAQPGAAATDAPRSEPVPPWAEVLNKPAKVTATRGAPLHKKNEVAPEGCKQALERFLTAEVRPVARYRPNTVFNLIGMGTYKTAENMAVLCELEGWEGHIRNEVGLGCISEVEGAATLLTVREHFTWDILPARDTDIDDSRVYTVLINADADQVSLPFVFYGEYVSQKPVADAATARSHRQADADATPTFELASLVEKASSIDHSGQPVLRLRITEPGQPGQPSCKVDVTSLPLLMGRGSACGLQLHSAYMSRIHACIRLQSNGKLVLESNSAKGVRLDADNGNGGKDLAMGQTAQLPFAGSFTLAAGAGAGATRIEFEQCHSNEDCVATLKVDDEPTQRAEVIKQLLTEAKPVPMPLIVDMGTSNEDDAPATFCFTSDGGGTGKPNAKPLARLWVSHADGSLSNDMIYELPYVIGREPKQANATKVRDPDAKASREHLLIEKIQGGAFLTENLAFAPGKGGTWKKTRTGSESMGQRFAWQPGQPGAQDGWLELGHQRGDEANAGRIAQVRIERVL